VRKPCRRRFRGPGINGRKCGLGDVACKLKKVMSSLRKWSMEKFGAVTKEIAMLKAKIEDLSSQDHVANKEEVDKCTQRMEELLYRK
jgi:hypothetical protein